MGAPIGAPSLFIVSDLAAAAAIVVAAAAIVVVVATVVVAAAAAAEQQDQDDDPPAAIVTEQTHIIIAAHKNTSEMNFLSDLPLIPWYSAEAKMCGMEAAENSFGVLTNLS